MLYKDTKLDSILEAIPTSELKFKKLKQLYRKWIFRNLPRVKGILSQMELLAETSSTAQKNQYHLYSGFWFNQTNQFKESVYHYQKAIEGLSISSKRSLLSKVYIEFSVPLLNMKNLSEAEECIRQAKKIAKKPFDKKLEAEILTREAFLKIHFKDFIGAGKLFREAEAIWNEISKSGLDIKDVYHYSINYFGLGNVYEEQNNHTKAAENFLESARLAESAGIVTRLPWLYMSLGKSLQAKDDFVNAELYYTKSIQYSNAYSKNVKAMAMGNLGYCKYSMDDSSSAAHLWMKASDILQKESEKDHRNLAIIESWRALLYGKMNLKSKALNHFIEAFEEAKQTDDPTLVAGICKDIASFYADSKEFELAFQYQLLVTRYQEESDLRSKQNELLALELKYDSQRKDQEMELMRLQAVTLQTKALRAQMNPHFVSNALNAIQQFVTGNNPAAASTYLSKFSKLMRHSLEYTDQEKVDLEEEIDFLDKYLELNKKLRFQDKLNYEFVISKNLDTELVMVPSMIIQPYIENAIEHGIKSKSQGKIKIVFEEFSEHIIQCTVLDDGIGRDRAAILQAETESYFEHKSRGTSITEERLRILHERAGSLHKDRKFDPNSNQDWVVTSDLLDINGNIAGTKVVIKMPIMDF
jgi:two-component system, LytTR family, sensor kinase